MNGASVVTDLLKDYYLFLSGQYKDDDIEEIEKTEFFKGITMVSYTIDLGKGTDRRLPISVVGMARCAERYTFSKRTGYMIAKERAKRELRKILGGILLNKEKGKEN